MDINKKFATRLKKLRLEAELTQEETAARAGIDYKHYQKLESKNPPSPTLDTLEKLSKALKLSISDITDL